jgi:hypothetical protein
MNKDPAVEDYIEELLRKSKIKYKKQPFISGLRPDFIVFGPNGESIILETKTWDPKGGNTARALDQVNYYKKTTGIDQAFIIFRKLKRNFESKGVISADSLIPTLNKYFDEIKPAESHAALNLNRTGKIIFAAMPFSKEYDDTYFVAMAYAANHVNAECKRVDRTEYSGDIVEEIKGLIKDSIAVIVDLSEGKSNVLYEAGYAHALGKPSIHICSTPLDELPFDVRNWNTILYEKGQTTKLRDQLARRLKAVVRS